MLQGEGAEFQIGLLGDKEFNKALKSMDDSLRLLNSDLKATDASYQQNDMTLQQMTEREEKLQALYEEQAKKVQFLREQLDKANASGDVSTARLQDLQLTLNYATAAMNKTGLQMEKNRGNMQTLAEATAKLGEDTETSGMSMKEAEQALKEMDEAAKEAGESTSDAGDAAGDMGDAADDAADGVGGFGEALAGAAEVAGGVFATGVEAVLGAMAAVGAAAAAALGEAFDLAQEAGKYADDLMTLSSQTGVDTDKLQEWEYASSFIDTSVDTITGSLTKLTKNMADAQDGSESAQEKFTKLGVSWRDFNGDLRDNEDVFMDAIDALGQIENPVERDAMAMELFGKSAKELNPLIEAGSRAWRDMGKEAQAMGTVFSAENLKKMGAFDDSMQKFKATGTALKNSIGLVMIPAFQPLVDAASSSMGKVAAALQEGVSPEEMEALLDKLINTAIDAFDGVLGMVEDKLPMVTKMVNRIINHIAEALPELTRVLLPAAMELMQSVLSGITDNVGPLTELATELITSVAGFLIESLPTLIDAAGQLLDGLIDGIIAALPELIPAAIEMIVKLAEGLIQGIPRLVEKLPEIVTAIWNGLKDTDWAKLGGEVLDSILAGIGSVGATIMDLLGVPADTQQAVIDAWSSFAELVSGGIKGVFDGIVTFLGGLFNPPAEDDQTGISALWNSFADLVGTGITGVLKAVVDFFGALFDPPADGEQAATSQQWGTFAETLKGALETGLKGAAELVSGVFTAGKAAIEAFPWEDTGTKLGTLAGKIAGFTLEGLSGVFDAGTAAVAAFPWEDVGTKLGTLAGQLALMVGDAIGGVFTAGSAAIETFPWEDTGTKLGTLAGQATAIALDAIGGVFTTGSAAIEAFPWEDTGTKLGTLAGQATAIPLDALSGVFTGADAAIKAIDWTALGESVGILVNGVTGIEKDALSGIFTATETAIKEIDWTSLGNDIADGLSRAWGILAGTADVALGLGESVVGAGKQGVGALKDWIASWRKDESVASEASDVGAQVIIDVAAGVTAQTPDLEATAKETADALLEALRNALIRASSDAEKPGTGIGKTLVGDIGTGVEDKEPDLLDTVGDLSWDAKDELERAVIADNFATIGWEMDAGIAAGVVAGSWMIEVAARSAALAAYWAACAALGINSPSKMGAWIGEMFDLGFAEGIEDNADAVMDAVDWLNDLAAADEAEAGGRIAAGGRQTNGAAVDYDRFKAAFVEAIEETGMGDIVMAMDGRIVGETVEPHSSRATRQRQQKSVKGRTARLVMA